jgi:hypothetical protein
VATDNYGVAVMAFDRFLTRSPASGGSVAAMCKAALTSGLKLGRNASSSGGEGGSSSTESLIKYYDALESLLQRWCPALAPWLVLGKSSGGGGGGGGVGVKMNEAVAAISGPYIRYVLFALNCLPSTNEQ